MQKINIAVILFLLLPLSLSAQQGIEALYIEMPEILNPVISEKQRHELLEYYKADMGDSIMNRFGTQTHMLSLDTLNHYLSVRNTDVSVFEMKMFENNTDTLIGIIKTVCTPVCMSVVNFYNTKWREVNLNFTLPKTTDWIDKDKFAQSGLEEQNVRNALSTNFISLTFSANEDKIIAKNNILLFLDETDKEIYAPLLKTEDIIYRLTEGKWGKD
ncbi:DUF3256 family protein [Paludibacter sp. 221]|uniref:DUF3256 family protein n=1 Tax=Paludibacter sp. 221 TaxID=2302939 RepID=UPI0013D517F9|nr:DUF3256 family protein [Paludibacter sp. 221]